MFATRRAAAAAAALTIFAAACSSGTGSTEDVVNATTTTAPAPGSTTAPAGGTGTGASTETSVVSGIIVAMVGETITTKEDNLVTVHSFEAPLGARHPDPTKIYAAADIEACAGKSSHDAGVAPGFFRVELRNRTQWPPVQPVKQPALQPTELAPGRCARGWVSFSLPRTIEPVLVTLRSSTNAAWRLR